MSRREEDDRLIKRQLAENIGRRRTELGIGRAECARRAEVSVSEIAALEDGERQPLASTLKKVAGALDWELSDLLDGLSWVMPTDDGEGHIEREGRRR